MNAHPGTHLGCYLGGVYLWFFRGLSWCAPLQFGLDLHNSGAQALLNCGDALTVAQVPGLVEMLEISAKFHQQLVRRPETHWQQIVAHNSGQRCEFLPEGRCRWRAGRRPGLRMLNQASGSLPD